MQGARELEGNERATHSLMLPWTGLSGRKKTMTARQNPPMGRLIQKHQRHEIFSAMTPPRRGPPPFAMAMVISVTPWYLPRSRSETTSLMMISVSVMSPPPPKPCMPRKTMS